MKRMLMAVALVATACGSPSTVSAKSKFYNSVEGRIEVYWTAAGCAGTYITCGAYWQDFACKKKTLRTGESGSYNFKAGTSFRQVAVVHCSSARDDFTNTGNKGNKKRCAAITNTNGKFGIKCGYSEEEYKALKNEDPTAVEYPIRGFGSRSGLRRGARD